MAREPEKDYSAAHEATIRKWEREEEKRKDSAEHFQHRVKETLRKIVESTANRQNVARDLKDTIESRRQPIEKEGFDQGDELITGFEGLPWDRD